jgi:hypothetical protein
LRTIIGFTFELCGFWLSSDDFQSLDTTLATTTRNADGNIPATTLFRLTGSSKIINAGADLGYDYAGSAPDLGPFERGSESTNIRPHQGPSVKARRKVALLRFTGKTNQERTIIFSRK